MKTIFNRAVINKLTAYAGRYRDIEHLEFRTIECLQLYFSPNGTKISAQTNLTRLNALAHSAAEVLKDLS